MTKEEIKKDKIILTYDQVRELAEEVLEIGEEAFLVKRKAIKVEESGVWTVMEYVGLRNANREAIYGYKYETDIPYMFWQEILRQVNFYIKRKEDKEKAQNKGLEEMAVQSQAYVAE